MSLEDIADRIAATPGWFGPSDQPDGDQHWYIRVHIAGDDPEIGAMTLTDEWLEITDYGIADIDSFTRRAEGDYDLIQGRYNWKRHSPEMKSTMRFWSNDRVTSSGPPTRLMLHWLAHALDD